MKDKEQKIESIDELARLTQHEFLEVGDRLDRLEKKTDDGFKRVVDLLDLIRADVHDVKITLGPLTRTVADLEGSVRCLDRGEGGVPAITTFSPRGRVSSRPALAREPVI